MTIKIPNKTDAKSGSDKSFPILPADEYQFKIAEFVEKKKPKYLKPTEMEDIVTFTLEVTGFKDGQPAVDSEGGQANGRKMWFDLNPAKLGFTQSDLPSISRSFLGYALGLDDLEKDFELDGYSQLVGKTVYAEIITKTNTQNRKVNKIARFLKTPRVRS